MRQNKSILIKNIYYMLAYAFISPYQSGFDDMEKEEFSSVHNLFAAILSKGISQQLKQGLYREYTSADEDLMTVRGRIRMPETMRNRTAGKHALSCEYDELSENTLLNQILKTTAMLLLKHPWVDEKHRINLKKEMLFFSEVDLVDPRSVRWNSIRFQRHNSSYRMLMGVCQLVLEGMLMTTESGGCRLASFVDDQQMCRLYEKFLLNFYVKECPYIKAAPSQIAWDLDDGVDDMLPTMQSDVTLSRGNDILIIDAKYYSHTTQTRYSTHSINSPNLQQIYTYVKNTDSAFKGAPHTVSGMLLYAMTDEVIQPNQVYQMSGNKISARTLDLNRDFSQIAAQLHAIAEEHFPIVT